MQALDLGRTLVLGSIAAIQQLDDWTVQIPGLNPLTSSEWAMRAKIMEGLTILLGRHSLIAEQGINLLNPGSFEQSRWPYDRVFQGRRYDLVTYRRENGCDVPTSIIEMKRYWYADSPSRPHRDSVQSTLDWLARSFAHLTSVHPVASSSLRHAAYVGWMWDDDQIGIESQYSKWENLLREWWSSPKPPTPEFSDLLSPPWQQELGESSLSYVTIEDDRLKAPNTSYSVGAAAVVLSVDKIADEETSPAFKVIRIGDRFNRVVLH